MSTIYTPEMIAKFKALTDDFEIAIRKDERDRIVDKMRGNLFAEQTASPLPESGLQPNDVKTLETRKVQLHEGHHRVIRLLSRGNYLAAPTIAGLIDVKRSAVWTYLQQINASDDYMIEKKQLPGRARGYRTLYRLAKSA